MVSYLSALLFENQVHRSTQNNDCKKTQRGFDPAVVLADVDLIVSGSDLIIKCTCIVRFDCFIFLALACHVHRQLGCECVVTIFAGVEEHPLEVIF